MRPKTTGKFRTRAELVHKVRFLYYKTSLSMSAVAAHCKVSFGVANAIIDSREWESLDYPDDWMYSDDEGQTGVLNHEDETFEPKEKLTPCMLQTCGTGYDLPNYPVHLPAYILNQMEWMD